ncbi:MAG TPA: hypothetical protein VK582_09125 [Pyrinomonadaceae bacterium]|nr:hypothetical protein [Pyrinomonadaceae bacterium]
MESDCALGSKGQWFGWQCRWYGLPSGRAIGTTRRNKIAAALKKSLQLLPDLTDWVLWTRHTLTKGDQKWFYGLKTTVRLHLWTSENVETLLSGDAEILRRTYFGELALTPHLLAELHSVSIAPIQRRWLPEAHQTVDAERTLRRMLGEARSWDELTEVANRLNTAVQVIEGEPRAFDENLLTPSFVKAARSMSETLEDAHTSLANGDFQILQQQLTRRRKTVKDISTAPRQLRSLRLLCALQATNALADMRRAMRLLDEIDHFLSTRLIAVVADAGGGKTQLSAQLTAQLQDRPAGILLFGRELHSGRTLDDLAKRVSIHGSAVPTMDALIAALDAAGQRGSRRLPLVIDGLNEAEDPREWKDALSSLNVLLSGFANVLVVVTLRTGARRPVDEPWHLPHTTEPPARMDFAKQAVPEGVQQIEIANFGKDTLPAIARYFRYFRINPGDADLPLELLSHPLTLRIFCEVTNPQRNNEVGVEAMPGSLTGLFEKYIDRATERISQLAPRTHRYYDQDIRSALDIIGTKFWETNQRELDEAQLRKDINDEHRPWNESIVHMLEQEGVILRVPSFTAGRQNVIPVYDALGGYLIANALLTRLGRDGFEPWLKDSETLKQLEGGTADCHPLALDIFRSLAGLVPRRLYRQQLWQLLAEPMRSVALRMAANLEGEYLDSATIAALTDYLHKSDPDLGNLFRRLYETRGATNHPLNADFLDAALRSLTMSQRDLTWTEWIRRNRKAAQKDVQRLEERWRTSAGPRTQQDRLRAIWVMWLLTTTSHNLRDRATRALYRFGRGNPTWLFEQTERSAEINDPYVFERMLTAVYGVAMAIHTERESESRKEVLPNHARRIFELMFGPNAAARTTHTLTREYARRIVELGSLQKRKLFSGAELDVTRPPYSAGRRICWQELQTDEERSMGENSPFRMDFENNTLGWLAQGRGNYDFRHEGYKKIRANVLWRIQQLGWTPQRFSQVDRAIEADRRYFGRGEEHDKVDRYGKKYSWIAYHEIEGFLRDSGLLTRGDNNRPFDIDIDPSFPSPTAELQLINWDLLGPKKLSRRDWLKKGPTPDLSGLFRQSIILNEIGPWVMLDGYVSRQDESHGRRLFAFVRSFIVKKNDTTEFLACLNNQSLTGRWLPEKPETRSVFAGEVPWCDVFPKTSLEDIDFVVSERTVKVRHKKPVFFLDGKEIDINTLARQVNGLPLRDDETAFTEEELARLVHRNRMIEVEEVRRETKRFRPLIPVYDLEFEPHDVDDVPIRGVTLAKQLAQGANLFNLPQTHDLQTADGVRATFGVTFQPQDWNNSERFFFIRQSVLRAILKKHDWRLVWAVWGERELSVDQIKNVSREDLADLQGGDFQRIYRY